MQSLRSRSWHGVTLGKAIYLPKPQRPPLSGTVGGGVALGMPAIYWMPVASLEGSSAGREHGLGQQSIGFPPSHPRHKLADQRTRKSLGRGEFRLLHYAGEVTYSVTGEDPGFGALQWAGRGAHPHLTSALPPRISG